MTSHLSLHKEPKSIRKKETLVHTSFVGTRNNEWALCHPECSWTSPCTKFRKILRRERVLQGGSVVNLRWIMGDDSRDPHINFRFLETLYTRFRSKIWGVLLVLVSSLIYGNSFCSPGEPWKLGPNVLTKRLYLRSGRRRRDKEGRTSDLDGA